MQSVTRRDFLQDTATLIGLAAAGVGAAGSARADEAPKRDATKGPQDRLRVAVVGVKGRGMDHVKGFLNKQHNCDITVVCDADEAVIGPAMTAVEKAQGKAPKFVQDVRKVVEANDIDVISIATPNHWHALAAIWALQRGKDVYVEKPVSHNVYEGRKIVEAARKYNRICQTGTQIRSNPGTREAIEFLRSGKLGTLVVARGLCYKARLSIGKSDGEQKVPASVDYDLWCGPAPKKPLTRKRLHYDWHWTWDYGNGDLGNQGIHQMDVARWGLGSDKLCSSVVSLGGRFGYEDDGETANTQICVFDYGKVQLIFEVRGLPTDKYKGAAVGNVFHCTDGYLVCTSYDAAVAYNAQGERIQEFKGGGDHYGNFVAAVRNRKSSNLKADILEGHLSSALCHLGNISYRLGTLAKFDKARAAFGDNKAAVETLERTHEHLRGNKLPVDGLEYRVGRALKLDPVKEVFVGDKEADAMLTRDYRKGFEVPDKV